MNDPWQCKRWTLRQQSCGRFCIAAVVPPWSESILSRCPRPALVYYHLIKYFSEQDKLLLCFALGSGRRGTQHSHIHLHPSKLRRLLASDGLNLNKRRYHYKNTHTQKQKEVGFGQAVGNMEDGELGPCRIIKIPHSLRPWPAAEFCSQVRDRNCITKLDGSWRGEAESMPVILQYDRLGESQCTCF